MSLNKSGFSKARYLNAVIAAFLAAVAAVMLTIFVAAPPAEAAGTVVKTCTGSKMTLSNAEATMLKMHNRYRVDNGRKPLCIHPKLQKAARAHSADMIRRDYFSHTTKGTNKGPAERIEAQGYRWSRYAENIAGGPGAYGGPKNIFRAWKQSSSHRPNILDGRLKEVGIGARTGEYKGDKGYTMWTADFGTRR